MGLIHSMSPFLVHTKGWCPAVSGALVSPSERSADGRGGNYVPYIGQRHGTTTAMIFVNTQRTGLPPPSEPCRNCPMTPACAPFSPGPVERQPKQSPTWSSVLFGLNMVLQNNDNDSNCHVPAASRCQALHSALILHHFCVPPSWVGSVRNP